MVVRIRSVVDERHDFWIVVVAVVVERVKEDTKTHPLILRAIDVFLSWKKDRIVGRKKATYGSVISPFSTVYQMPIPSAPTLPRPEIRMKTSISHQSFSKAFFVQTEKQNEFERVINCLTGALTASQRRNKTDVVVSGKGVSVMRPEGNRSISLRYVRALEGILVLELLVEVLCHRYTRQKENGGGNNHSKISQIYRQAKYNKFCCRKPANM